MAEDIRIGIIGVGMIGKSHINGYAKVPGAKIVAVADVNEAEATRVAAEHNIPQVFTSFRDLLALDEIDAVDVCLHNNLHSPVTIAALEAGKHVYCEKPMAGAYVDAKNMYDAAEAHRQEAPHPAFDALQQGAQDRPQAHLRRCAGAALLRAVLRFPQAWPAFRGWLRDRAFRPEGAGGRRRAV